jgi:hypothetical protein
LDEHWNRRRQNEEAKLPEYLFLKKKMTGSFINEKIKEEKVRRPSYQSVFATSPPTTPNRTLVITFL